MIFSLDQCDYYHGLKNKKQQQFLLFEIEVLIQNVQNNVNLSKPQNNIHKTPPTKFA